MKRRMSKKIKFARVFLFIFVMCTLLITAACLIEKDLTVDTSEERNDVIENWHFVIGICLYVLFILLILCVLRLISRLK